MLLLSFAYIFILGLLVERLCQSLRIPSLVGYLFLGILLGPYALNLLDPTILDLSADLRQVALIIILTRAGLSLDIRGLIKVGRPALLMCFLPATFEMIATSLLAPSILGISQADALVLGAVLGAVSPAVVVPKMLKLIDEGYGTKKQIPQLILAGSSADDIYVLVLFSSFLAVAQGGSFQVTQLLTIPISIALGLLVGGLLGAGLNSLFDRFDFSTAKQLILLLSLSFVLVSVEKILPALPFSGILAVMAMGLVINRLDSEKAVNLGQYYNKLWIPGEILLFVLVGASVNITYAFQAGWQPVLLIGMVLIFRSLGVLLSLAKTHLSLKERLFSVIAYLPKATVQAAIGGVPLAMGLGSGEIILTVSVLAILITAPLGAFGIDLTYQKNLQKEVK
ncbi:MULTISPECIES: cation:proton antiporter [Aerococcus]|uniref:cation:proton antiporter n=1 Tax=Aerococcus urinae (strain CCUG 59500 / ACS-120-V-Col10a) TaxID=2976812 RepID=UPI000200FD4C|nr:cation:proton antiporter [Aerococcus sp. Group 1]AEA00214.1 transporter, CPA2 family [Aerococcus sp. Group 1]MCY3031166.1 cation:proton antiporter [Aerococcus sp. Group 1]MCY3054197.1 cation:proton antiporter [Aerococcus sp. Group 1]MCY3055927.1 cation:proton antiporter [Aerococcus sp. Group 1]MCY3061650.1 cation:proton antiporter [Aerococcus sp. Group 1]